MKAVIVGGVAGGATAATRLRRLDEEADITIFERTGYVSYANCGLPYYIGGVIQDRSALTLQTPQGFWDRFRIDVKVHHEVTAIDPEGKTVTVKNLETGDELTERYDKLLLSPGAVPVTFHLPGKDLDGVFTLRTVEDTFAIQDYIDKNKPKHVVLAGGGYIGLELADNLRRLGIDVTIVQRPAQLMKPLDPEMASWLHSEALENGVKLKFGSTVDGFEQEDGKVCVRIRDEDPIKADMAVLAIGVSPDTPLAKQAGLELGIRGSIVVDDQMRTSIPDIYAVGDAVQIKQYVTGRDALISLAGPANRQARIAADNMAGIESHYEGSPGSSILEFFSLTAATTGLNESQAKAAGFDVDSVALSPGNHADYYPGSSILDMKVVFDKTTGRLLGGQIVGREGVDKRIDVLSCAIHAKLSVTELKHLDLSYAPPYSSAKDPVNLAGYIAEDVLKGLVKQWHVSDAAKIPHDGSVQLVDVRTAPEYEAGHAEDFRNIDVNELRERLSELDREKPIYLMCETGLRGYIACRILAQNGYDAYNLAGGFRRYAAATKERRLTAKAAMCGMGLPEEPVVCSFPKA